jgi:hypothetical protein
MATLLTAVETPSLGESCGSPESGAWLEVLPVEPVADFESDVSGAAMRAF